MFYGDYHKLIQSKWILVGKNVSIYGGISSEINGALSGLQSIHVQISISEPKFHAKKQRNSALTKLDNKHFLRIVVYLEHWAT